jgi:hypothetical protein
MKHVLFSVLLIIGTSEVRSQDHPPNASKPLVWSLMQLAPNYSWTTFPSATHFAFEWEAAPVLYSFGLNPLASPWKFFSATPVARFTGSVEAVLSAQVYTTKPGSSHFGFSGQLLGHIPLIERGEYASLTVGAARYAIDGEQHDFVVGGFSTFFGILQGTVKYAPESKLWMTSIDFRLF